MTTAFDLLAGHPFMHGLTDRQLDQLSTWARSSLFHAGARVFSEGGRADRFWLIQEGQVVLDTHVPGHGDVVRTLCVRPRPRLPTDLPLHGGRGRAPAGHADAAATNTPDVGVTTTIRLGHGPSAGGGSYVAFQLLANVLEAVRQSGTEQARYRSRQKPGQANGVRVSRCRSNMVPPSTGRSV